MTRTKPNDNDLYTPATLAEYWGCSERHVRNLLNEGELPHFKLGKKLIRIPGEAVDEYQARQMEAALSQRLRQAEERTDLVSDILYRARTDRLLRERRERIVGGGQP